MLKHFAHYRWGGERGEGSRTFVPGQISAQDDDEAQGDEDHHGHHSADERVVGAVLRQSVRIWRRRRRREDGVKRCFWFALCTPVEQPL